MKYLGVVLACSQAAARLQESPPPPPPRHFSSREHEAFQKLEDVCQVDVERHCSPPEEAMMDPILKWMMTPERLAPPMMHPEALEPMDPINIGPLLDHMMDTALRMPMMIQPQEPTFFLMIDTTPLEEEASDEFVLDSMVSRLMQQSDCDKTQQIMQAQEPIHNVAHHIRLKGQEVLEQEDIPEDRRRLARRLTEVSPEEMLGRWQQVGSHPWDQQHSRKHYHICPRKHKCLMQARNQNMLLSECSGALTRLEKVQDFEKKQREHMDLYMNFFWFYCVLFSVFFTMTLMRRFKSSKGLFFLRLRVLQAVYSNPEIKAKVEDEVGVPLGHVPPVPSVALKMLSREGRNQCHRKRLRFSRMLYAIMIFFTLDAFGLLPECWPLFVMGTCCVFMAVRIVSICFRNPEVRECKCCCCGGSTSDVADGTVSDAQACCTCCKGTGVCSAKCKSCCGGSAGTCCGGTCNCAKSNCCDGSCDCCSGTEVVCAMEYKMLASDDCKCCCCGGSAPAAALGLLTDKQACCTCCKGTGVCSPKCKSCCGGGAGTCCGGTCNCAKDNCCDGSCDCCSRNDVACTMKATVNAAGDCNCCCCGGSAPAAALGLLTDKQACCTCCKGTGVCSPRCKSCCGGGAGTCCGGTCNCAKDSSCDGSCDCCSGTKEAVTVGPNTVVYHGVPVQIV